MTECGCVAPGADRCSVARVPCAVWEAWVRAHEGQKLYSIAPSTTGAIWWTVEETAYDQNVSKRLGKWMRLLRAELSRSRIVSSVNSTHATHSTQFDPFDSFDSFHPSESNSIQ